MMTQEQFLSTLRRRLTGMNADEVDEVIEDYRGHFADGLAAGRTEDEISAALGDPARLAREMRAEAGVRRWETNRTPGNFASALFGLLALIAIDFMFLLPVLGVILGIAVAAIVIVFAMCLGGVIMMFNIFTLDMVSTLGGLSLLGFGVGIGAVSIILGELVIKALIHFARLHFTLFNRASQGA
jgi:uncharacterized membrane protein